MNPVARLVSKRVGLKPTVFSGIKNGFLAAPKSTMVASKWLKTPVSNANTSRNFSTSVVGLEGGKQKVEKELLRILKAEIEYEKEGLPVGEEEFITSFKEKTGFDIVDKVGENEVELVKLTGDEMIKVRFSINDIFDQQLQEEHTEKFEDYMEEEEGQNKQKQEQEEETTEQEEEEGMDNFDVNFVVTITKENSPITLYFDLIAEDGLIGFKRIMTFDKNKKTALQQSVEGEFARGTSYFGPVYGQLSEDLKDNIDEYLESRGIDSSLVYFIQDYIEFKEQNEYYSWLNNFKTFFSN
ncbi:Mitochondrial acidic protein MAM33 [Zancudomyces culisetae]|uniref:Mitochondrial acidic protein MAM33 n=1 Tax=Zancudomyces culisetae TaxID=1213189 RepID=A0A1R1PQX4_ZANCU|nr:Mitochondrial acidic protein MAM33 [Zancudomyces culisetae]|eukprot:OMH83386.1 Mitochondrial acidic protein MAM33 [Zancudomyces culisetae]